MPQVSQLQNPSKNSNTTIPSPFVQPETSPLSLEPYHNIVHHAPRGHSMDETSLSSLFSLGYDIESVPHSGSISEYSRKNKSNKFLKCFVPRWFQRRRTDTTFRDDSGKMMVVEVSKDYQQRVGMVHGVHRRKMKFLEEEVAELEGRLVYEQVVNEVLKYTHQQGSCSSGPIPTFLPPTLKGMLAEIGEVDDEIARLESQMSELQAHLAREQEVVRGLKSRNLQHQQQKN